MSVFQISPYRIDEEADGSQTAVSLADEPDPPAEEEEVAKVPVEEDGAEEEEVAVGAVDEPLRPVPPMYKKRMQAAPFRIVKPR